MILQHHGKDVSPHVVETLMCSRYVDDAQPSVASTKKAIETHNQCQYLLSPGSFHLRKWLLSDKTVLDSVPVAN